MFNEDFLSKILEKEDLSAEDKVKQIMGEHNADTRGLVQKRDELLGSEKKLKEQLKTLSDEKSGYEGKISDLETKLKESGSEELKSFYETKLNDASSRHKIEMDELTAKYNDLRGKHLEDLKQKAIENSVKDLAFVDNLKAGFISRVMAENQFEAKEIDGEIQFVSKDNHTIGEAINSFATTPEGKSYLRNPSQGGGAKGTENISNITSIKRSQFNGMTPEQQAEFCQNKDAKIVDD